MAYLTVLVCLIFAGLHFLEVQGSSAGEAVIAKAIERGIVTIRDLDRFTDEDAKLFRISVVLATRTVFKFTFNGGECFVVPMDNATKDFQKNAELKFNLNATEKAFPPGETPTMQEIVTDLIDSQVQRATDRIYTAVSKDNYQKGEKNVPCYETINEIPTLIDCFPLAC